MAQILRKAANYRRVSNILYEGRAHLTDPYTPAPVIIKPPAPRENQSPDDITDFPRQQTVPMPEMIPYPEGKWRPPSVPQVTGYFPYNCYLQKGKVYFWCSCGISQNSPWCDGLCNQLVTRNRPIYFNVNESGYYKMCNCKLSANAPFCNGTHREYVRFYAKTHRGFWEIIGQIGYWSSFVLMAYNFYT